MAYYQDSINTLIFSLELISSRKFHGVTQAVSRLCIEILRRLDAATYVA